MSHLEWTQKAYYEAGGGDRVGLLTLDDGHWAVVWAYTDPHCSMQVTSFDPERAQEVFNTSRNGAEKREGLRYDSRQEWHGSSL
ncbi:hypothetical protein [Streptomyces mirabilis]|uniref:hypothetical protein n=1 Tax=Streptomyces mirabilis TaxID=68239 RepID=UPI0022593C2F|nr:hypothetical protein [Streptomyces mirabilis]MCX4608696.1 hypothetical protein [Streptomyces mirabilis]